MEVPLRGADLSNTVSTEGILTYGEKEPLGNLPLNLHGTDMRGAIIDDSVFIGTDFSNSILDGASFKNAKLLNCKFKNEQLLKVDLTDIQRSLINIL